MLDIIYLILGFIVVFIILKILIIVSDQANNALDNSLAPPFIKLYPNFQSFPTLGNSSNIYIDKETLIHYVWDGEEYKIHNQIKSIEKIIMGKLDRVVCAANRHRISGDIILGVRHFDTLMHMQIDNSIGRLSWVDSEQGFVNQRGEFLTREEAWIVAEKAGQVIHRCGGDGEKLYSENLY